DLQRRVEELQREQTEFTEDAERHSNAAVEVRARLSDIEAQLADHARMAGAARQRRADLRAAIEAAEARLVTIRRELAGIEGTQTSIAERIATVAADRERVSTQTANEREQFDRLQHSVADLDAQIARVAERETAIQASIAEHLASATTAADGLAERRAALQTIEREVTNLQTRLDALERAHASGEGLYAGVRAILRAIDRSQLLLPGLVGTLAETVEVPAELETAIEVALGGHLQDLIVQTWSDAQEAIAFLKRTNAGRATFQPLDTVRPVRRPALSASDGDLRGVAADLVTFPEQVAPVVEQLLGRTLVVADLDATRRILKSASGWTIVTVGGEIARPSGSVTGGGRAAESGILARERERRALPATLAARNATRAEVQATIERAVAEVEKRETARRTLQSELESVSRQLRELRADREQQSRSRDATLAALQQADSRAETLEQREQGLRQESATLESRTAELEAEQRGAREERARVEALLAAEPEDVDAAAAGLRVELAADQERLHTAELSARKARERAESAQRSANERTAEIERLREAETDDAQRLRKFDAQILEFEQLVATGQAALPPIAQQRDEVVELLATAERTLSREAAGLREAERERDRHSLNLARVQDEQVFLVERIRSDLDLDDPSDLEAIEDDAPVPDEGEINRLRDRLRRMSNVGEDVLEQHDAESQRLTYLSGQLADIDEASDGLRRVLSELNSKMATRFTETFREVAVAFEHTFTRLFGGGSARLVMSANEDGAAGIDIVAQPPGKRLQNLNALSGGERALTAVALLIAIQRVNPSPFCLLDEVDAALDESNVVRFRDELRDLAGNTQYVVITHNRGTIEGADTLYGVTMGDDGVSRVLSLRLEEAIQAVEAYESAQPAGT
ncbi:MAG TPA: hypothetical protein VFV93_06795, partial [Thermomicrobiales bacterium]|nr:hypothetical protein [Thermomicrobiales bacterium]